MNIANNTYLTIGVTDGTGSVLAHTLINEKGWLSYSSSKIETELVHNYIDKMCENDSNATQSLGYIKLKELKELTLDFLLKSNPKTIRTIFDINGGGFNVNTILRVS